jgi:DNA-binding CsgD family transcriptional regulator
VSIVVDAACRVLDRDPRAQAMFVGGALTIRRGALHLKDRTNDAKMHAVVRAIGRGDRRCGVIDVRDRTLDLIVIRVAPLVRGAIIELLAPHAVLPATLEEMFGLSPAEADLALALMVGSTPKEIAAKRGVAVSTIRTQLRSVFSKTHTQRQADLIALLLRTCC